MHKRDAPGFTWQYDMNGMLAYHTERQYRLGQKTLATRHASGGFGVSTRVFCFRWSSICWSHYIFTWHATQ